MFCIADADKRVGVKSAIQPLGQTFGQKCRLVVAALAQAVGMQWDGNENVNGSEIHFCVDETFEQIDEVVLQPCSLVELEVEDKAACGFEEADCTSGNLVGRGIFCAIFADEFMLCGGGNESAADSAHATRLEEGKGREAVGTKVPFRTVRRTMAGLHGADPWPAEIGHRIEECPERVHVRAYYCFAKSDGGYSPASTSLRISAVTNGLSSR